MKVFDCSEGDNIVLDGRIFVEVAEVAEDEVCLKIEAPEEVRICLHEGLGTVA